MNCYRNSCLVPVAAGSSLSGFLFLLMQCSCAEFAFGVEMQPWPFRIRHLHAGGTLLFWGVRLGVVRLQFLLGYLAFQLRPVLSLTQVASSKPTAVSTSQPTPRL